MITIVSSTNRKQSVSLRIAHIYHNILKEKGYESEVLPLESLPADFTATALYENAGQNESFNILRKRMKESLKVIFIVPEYNGSFPGVLKAFIDGLEFPSTFTDKKAALVGVSAGVQGAGLALSHLTDIFNYCGTNVLAQKPKLFLIGQHLSEEDTLSKQYQNLLEEQALKFIEF